MLYRDMRKELSGYEPQTTNNRMELTAPIEALKALNAPCAIKLYSDSAYLINSFQKGWLANWQRNHWIKSDKKPVENQDLWKLLLEAAKPHQITWIKVKGHASNVENNRCDQLATGEIKRHASGG